MTELQVCMEFMIYNFSPEKKHPTIYRIYRLIFLYSKYLFAALTVADIAEKVVKCRSQVVDLESQDAVSTLVTHLIRGNPVVFPYPSC